MFDQTRPPAVAGLFYPRNVATLHQLISDLLSQAHVSAPTPKAMIVPHAGYIYSGPIAASAYACLLPVRDHIRRVVLMGPAHRVAFNGMAASEDAYFATPLGSVPIDTSLIQQLLDTKLICSLPAAHNQEHCLEVQLPFLQMMLSSFEVVPLLVGHASTAQVAAVLEAVWGDEQTLIVISSDLSHYHDYHTARQLDRATSNAIEALEPEAIAHHAACGCHPIQGLLAVAKAKELHVQTVDLRNSGDTAGDQDRVVGYGAYVFH